MCVIRRQDAGLLTNDLHSAPSLHNYMQTHCQALSECNEPCRAYASASLCIANLIFTLAASWSNDYLAATDNAHSLT
jgi:hypothetical protein